MRIKVAIPLVAVAALALAGLRSAGTPDAAGGAEAPVMTLAPSRFVRSVTAEGFLKAASATSVAAPLEAPGPFRIAWIAADGGRVEKGDVVVRFDRTELERSLAKGEAEAAKAEQRLAKSRSASIAEDRSLELDAEMALRELEAARAYQKRDAEIFSRYQIIESEIDGELAEERRRHAETVRGVRRRLSTADEDLIGIARQKVELDVERARKGLAALELTAPHGGLIVLTRNWRGEVPQQGQTVWNGYAIAEIPDTTSMNAEVFVLEADAGGLAVGQRAEVTLDSQPGVVHAATVERVDNLARPRQKDNPVQYFGVTLHLERTEPAVRKPGARLRAKVWLESREEAIVIPRQAVTTEEGQSYVHRREGAGFRKVPVVLGPASYGRVVVEKGLVSGDVIARRSPSSRSESRGGNGAAASPLAHGAGESR